MSEFDQLAAPGYPIFLGSEFKHPKPEQAFFHILAYASRGVGFLRRRYR